MQVYREDLPQGPNAPTTTSELVYLSTAPPAPLHLSPVLSRYPPLEGLQQKRLAARRHKTTFCYDFPAVFENALRQTWAARAAAGEPGAVPPPGTIFILKKDLASYTYGHWSNGISSSALPVSYLELQWPAVDVRAQRLLALSSCAGNSGRFVLKSTKTAPSHSIT